uniref:Uncharacterized protein n=1 Tax=Caenorhabditis japonica TaxID=281687 RepID=A0A8R1EXT1_CAEJA
MAEQSIVIQTAESTDCISSLIFWMIQNNLSNEVSESQKFCELLEKIILDSPAEKSTYLRNALTFSGSLLQFSPLHARLLSNYHNITDFNVIRNLALADSEEYFELTVSLLENYEFLEILKTLMQCRQNTS